MIPLPELLSELALGLGAALFGANALVYWRARSVQSSASKARPPSMTRVVVNMVVGAAVALIGLASLLNQR
jgi:cytochrome bd-type quinol oxidase subunit 2